LQGIVEDGHESDVIFVTDLIKELVIEGVGKIHHSSVTRLMKEIFGVELSKEMPDPPTPQREQQGFRGFKFKDAKGRAQWKRR
jgi:hypothetical protein